MSALKMMQCDVCGRSTKRGWSTFGTRDDWHVVCKSCSRQGWRYNRYGNIEKVVQRTFRGPLFVVQVLKRDYLNVDDRYPLTDREWLHDEARPGGERT